MTQDGEPGHVHIHDPLPKNNAPTFPMLSEVGKEIKGKGPKRKADRNMLQLLITAYEAGQMVNLQQILQHELIPVLLALA